MELVIQNAIEKAKRQHMRSNLPGTISALAEALETCSEENAKLIYFEMATFYQQYGHATDSFSMLVQALDRGYTQEVIDKFILKHFIKDKKYEENYNHNKDLLSKYIYYKGKKFRSFESLTKYVLYSDNSYTIFFTSDRKIIYDKNPDLDIPSNNEGTVLFLDNTTNIAQMLLLNKVTQKIDTRKSPLYVSFERTADLECLLTFVKLDSFLAENRAIIFIGAEETESYFSDLQSILPTHVVKTSIEPINTDTTNPMLKEIMDKRRQRIERAFAVIEQNYTGNQESIYSEIKKSNIKILFLSTRFDVRSSDTIMQYYAACLKLGYKCQSIIEKSEILASRDMEYIMIERFVPNIIFAVNSFRYERAQYPKELIFLTYLENIEGLDLAELLSVMTKNDYIFAGTVVYHKLFRAGFPVSNIIELPLVVDQFYEDKNPIRNLMYKCDVCIIADNSDVSVILTKIQSTLLETYPGKESEISNALNTIKSKYLTLFFAETFVLGRKETQEIVSEAFSSNNIDLDEEMLHNLTEEFRTNYSRSLYNTTIANWLLRSGFTKIKLWGKEWQNNPSFREYSLGPILSEDVLKKAMSNAKIVVGSDLFEVDIISIYNSFVSGAMYLQNNLYLKEQLIALEIGGKNGNGVQYFSGKQNFLSKVTYFTENEQLRTEIIKKGRALFTMESVCKKNLPLILAAVTKSLSDEQTTIKD